MLMYIGIAWYWPGPGYLLASPDTVLDIHLHVVLSGGH
jgi:hypothetical protein